MQPKGDKIGEKSVTLKRYRNSNNSQNVRQQINISGSGVDCGQELFVEAYESHGSTGWAGSWKARVYDSKCRITFPKDKIESSDLLPGDTIAFEFYEIDNEQISDSTDIIDRTSAPKDKDNQDNLQSHLNSKKVCKHIQEQNGLSQLKLRNVKNGKSSIYFAKMISNSQNNTYRFNFPSDVREEIDAKPGDLIEVIGVGATENAEKDLSQEEMIVQTHRMVREMYAAYIENKDA